MSTILTITRRRLVASALSVALVTSVVACGADGDKKATSTTAAESTTTTGDAPSTSSDKSDPESSTTETSGGSSTAEPTTTAGSGGTTSGFGSLAEGSYTGFFRSVTSGSVEGQAVQVVGFDDVDLLTGQEAIDAAIAAGDAEPGATSLDTDYYLRNLDETPVLLPVIPEGQVWILVGGSPDTVSGSIDEAFAQGGLYRIEVVVVRGVSLITGVEGIYLA